VWVTINNAIFSKKSKARNVSLQQKACGGVHKSATGQRDGVPALKGSLPHLYIPVHTLN